MYRILGADGRQYGPVPAEGVRQWILEGRANAETRTLVEEGTEWKPLGSFPEFAAWLAAQPPRFQPAPTLTTYTASAPNNGFAIAGLVCGVLALPMFCCCYGFPFNLLGVLFSIIALVQIQQDPQRYRGRELAVIGLILSVLSFVLSFLFVLLFGALGVLKDGGAHSFRL
jgi:hypothetical protein